MVLVRICVPTTWPYIKSIEFIWSLRGCKIGSPFNGDTKSSSKKIITEMKHIVYIYSFLAKDSQCSPIKLKKYY